MSPPARALALASLLAVASAGLLQPNSSALLFKNETLAAIAAKNLSIEALRAHAAGLAATALPDKEAALLSKPRPYPYPQGTCTPCNDKTNCPGRTCDQGTCPSYTYAGALGSRAATECASNFEATCEDPANSGCQTCALWQEVVSRCAPMGAAPLGCVSRGDYVIMPSREVVLFGGVAQLCTSAQMMLVPTRPCSGVDSANPLCTGSKAEYWWGAVFDEAVLYGIAPGPLTKPPPPSTTLRVWGRDVPVAPNAPSWGACINAANRRSQHQTHLRFAKWQPVDEGNTAAYSNILPDWLTVETFSVDKNAPTRVVPSAPIVDADGKTQWPLIAAVFVPTGAKPDAGAANVWATASKVAHGVDPNRPYGIVVAPRWQAALGPVGGPVVPGVTVSAMFDLGAGQIVDETPNPNDCVGACAAWDVLWWEGKGARPAPKKNWLQTTGPDPASSAIVVPPKPAGYTDKEWYQRLSLSW